MRERWRRWFAVGLVAAACGGRAPAATTSNVPVGNAAVVAAGAFELPAAGAFADPGFHQVVTTTVSAAKSGAGKLVLRIRDAGRPAVSCDREHPLSGCATVDWSDFEDRPGVPPGGVFDNSLSVHTTAGGRTLYLRESGILGEAPDDYAPG